jgi:hypothetical protein
MNTLYEMWSICIVFKSWNIPCFWKSKLQYLELKICDSRIWSTLNQ